MNKALILFAHGARDPEWARPVQAVAQRLQAENPDLPVTIAFLEFMSPALPDAIDLIARQTTGAVPLRQEVPTMLAEIRQQHPQLQIRLLPPLGELPSVQDAIAQAITQLL